MRRLPRSHCSAQVRILSSLRHWSSELASSFDVEHLDALSHPDALSGYHHHLHDRDAHHCHEPNTTLTFSVVCPPGGSAAPEDAAATAVLDKMERRATERRRRRAALAQHYAAREQAKLAEEEAEAVIVAARYRTTGGTFCFGLRDVWFMRPKSL